MKEKLPQDDSTFTKIGKSYSTTIGSFYHATNICLAGEERKRIIIQDKR
jgi:hypothetical protein